MPARVRELESLELSLAVVVLVLPEVPVVVSELPVRSGTSM